MGARKMVNIANFILKKLKCPWIKKLTTSDQPSGDIFLAIHGHDAVGKNILDFGDVYRCFIPKNNSF